ncbi:CU044_2847 family protein [Streptomyces phaeochromogenes]|uniref:CU044_2847 family protein n=1 Tax=Streptomyces phaeochromogenes TaxID=1923 RepID=UPI0033EF7C52
MATITTIELDDGSLLRVETATPTAPRRAPAEAYEPIGRPRPAQTAETVGSAADTLRDAVDRVRPAVQDVVDSLRAMPRRPDRITLEFGVKVTAEAGVVLARTAAEAHFTVGVEWESTGGRDGSSDV